MSLKILLLFDLEETPPLDQEYAADLREEGWESEADILSALRALGHQVKLFGVCDDIRPLLDEIERDRPDLVFNLFEAFAGDRAREADVAALLELLGIAFTGARPEALRLCKNKALAKKILAYHGVPTPRFATVARGARASLPKDFRYPALVKPLALEGSMGITRESVVKNAQAVAERVRFVHEKLEQDALIEEFIDGRELYVGVLGSSEGIEVFPPRELFFKGGERAPGFLTYKAKWDDAYRLKWGVRTAQAKTLPPEIALKLDSICRETCAALSVTGYARIDLRLTPEGELFVLEVNPNPSIAASDEFARAAVASGLRYPQLVERILKLAL